MLYKLNRLERLCVFPAYLLFIHLHIYSTHTHFYSPELLLHSMSRSEKPHVINYTHLITLFTYLQHWNNRLLTQNQNCFAAGINHFTSSLPEGWDLLVCVYLSAVQVFCIAMHCGLILGSC